MNNGFKKDNGLKKESMDNIKEFSLIIHHL